MTQAELLDRIRLGEDSKTEFKERFAHTDEIAASMVCLANVLSGDLILGVSDKGDIRGLENVDRVIETIENVSRQNVEPPIPIKLEKFLLEGKVLLVVHVMHGPQLPYRTNRGVYYVRVGKSCRIASRQDVLEMYQATGSVYADVTSLPQTGPSDLDSNYLAAMRPELFPSGLQPSENSLRAVNIMGDEGLTLGGFLCFGRGVQRLRPYARVTLIRFRGAEVDQTMEDRVEIEGRLDQQYHAALETLRKHLRLEERIPLPEEPEADRLPMDAVKEALVNALVHRDYFQNAQVRLFTFSDRLEVISPGRLLSRVSIEAIRAGYHLVRNPVIFSHFARLRLGTDAGLGIPNMIRIARQHGVPEPEILVNSGEVRVVFRFKA